MSRSVSSSPGCHHMFSAQIFVYCASCAELQTCQFLLVCQVAVWCHDSSVQVCAADVLRLQRKKENSGCCMDHFCCDQGSDADMDMLCASLLQCFVLAADERALCLAAEWTISLQGSCLSQMFGLNFLNLTSGSNQIWHPFSFLYVCQKTI